MLHTELHLCDTCIYQKSFPDCRPKHVQYGSDVGGDNIIRCKNYEETIKKSDQIYFYVDRNNF